MRIALAALLLAACNGDSKPVRPAPPTTEWELGPLKVGGASYSLNCPTYFKTTFTMGPCEPHYVTRAASLVGKSRIRARFKLEGPEDAIIHGAKCSLGSPSAVTLFFSGENLSGRWWAKSNSSPWLKPNMEFEISAGLVPEQWGPVLDGYRIPFEQDLAKATRVGFTFSNCEGYGHGAVATKPVTFTVLEFKVL